MARNLTCDVCGKPTNRIVAKLMLIPVNGKSFSFSDYSGHADVGECCGSRIPQMVKFRKRKPRAKKPLVPKEAEVV